MLATIKSAALTLAFATLFIVLGIPTEPDLLGVLFACGLVLFWPRLLRGY